MKDWDDTTWLIVVTGVVVCVGVIGGTISQFAPKSCQCGPACPCVAEGAK